MDTFSAWLEKQRKPVMSETSIRENSRSAAGVKITMDGATSTVFDFSAKAFANAIMRTRKRPGGKSLAEREALQRKAEAKLAQR